MDVFDNDESQMELFKKWDAFFYHDFFVDGYYLTRPIEAFADKKGKVRVIKLKQLVSKTNGTSEKHGMLLPEFIDGTQQTWLAGMSIYYYMERGERVIPQSEHALYVQFDLEPDSGIKCLIFDCDGLTDQDLGIVNQEQEFENVVEPQIGPFSATAASGFAASGIVAE